MEIPFRPSWRYGSEFNGYSPLELLKIEATFLKAYGYKIPLHYKNNKPQNAINKAVLFDGLVAVVDLLCKLDNIPNIMNYTALFEYENDKPKYQIGSCY